jgi:hypothetical protein
MPYVVSVTVVIGAVAILNLILTFGVIRRLREHSELLAAGGPGAPDVMLSAGAAPAEFAATTTDGARVTRDDLGGEMLIGFLSPGCEPCREQAPRFVERAGALAGGRSRALAVVIGEQPAVQDLLRQLEPVARVVIERDINAEGTVSHAFGVRAFPAFATLDDGVVASSGWQLPEQPTARLSSLAS